MSNRARGENVDEPHAGYADFVMSDGHGSHSDISDKSFSNPSLESSR